LGRNAIAAALITTLTIAILPARVRLQPKHHRHPPVKQSYTIQSCGADTPAIADVDFRGSGLKPRVEEIEYRSQGFMWSVVPSQASSW
jgi:hypothetical protein